MDFDSYARRLWAGRADAYEHGFARLTVHAVGALLDAAGVGTGTWVLDVGTGPGVVAGAAAARGARVTVIDAELSMAEAPARNVPGLDVRVAAAWPPGTRQATARSPCPPVPCSPAGPALRAARKRCRGVARAVEHALRNPAGSGSRPGPHLRLMPRARVVNVGLLKLGALPAS